ncbi:hypothetical protein AAH029_01145 [Parabacteroides distasonis]
MERYLKSHHRRGHHHRRSVRTTSLPTVLA